MAKTLSKQETARLFGAAIAAAVASFALGPDDYRHQTYTIAMSMLVLLGGWIRSQTDASGITGRVATSALGCLLLAPAIGIRVKTASEAFAKLADTSPHSALVELPGISSSVVESTGPLMFGAGIALIILAGRLSGTVVGAILGGATCAWASQTILMEIDRAVAAERFDDFIMLSHGLNFIGLICVLGALAGAVFTKRGHTSLSVRRLASLKEAKRAALEQERRARKEAAQRAQAEAEVAAAEAKKAESSEGEGAEDAPDEAPPLDPEAQANLDAINAALYATPLLHSLEDEELETIAPSFERQQLTDGEVLFSEGDRNASIFIVCRGEVQIWKKDKDGGRYGLARLSAGSLLGEMAVIEKRPRSASASASGHVEVIQLTSEGFDKLQETHPSIITKIQIELIQLIASRLRRTSTDLLQVAEGETVDQAVDAPKMANRKGTAIKGEEMAPLVAESRLLQSLEEADIQALASTIEQVKFEDMDHLVAVGSSIPAMHVVTSGRVQIWRRNSDQQKVELAILGPGDPIGEMALFESGARTANATAIGEVKTLRITQSAIKKLTAGHPEVAMKLYQAFLEALSERLRSTSEQLVQSAIPLPSRPSTPPPEAPQAASPMNKSEADQGHDNDLLVDEEDDQLLDPEDEDDGQLLDPEDEDDGQLLDPEDDYDEDDYDEDDYDEDYDEDEEEEEPIVVELTAEEADPNSHLSEAQIKRQTRTNKGLAVLATLTAYWAATAPWFELAQALPTPATGMDVPTADPGLPNAQRPMDPFGTDFAAALEARGHKRQHSRPWPCLPDVYDRNQGYGSHPRKTETLAVTTETPVVELSAAITDMRKRGVYRMGLLGQASPPYGALGELLAWPSVQLLIDSPPRTVQWIELHPRKLEKLPLLPGADTPTSCALLVDEEVNVDQLYSTVRSLSSPFGDPACQKAVVLVLPDDGSTTNSHPGWRGCP